VPQSSLRAFTDSSLCYYIRRASGHLTTIAPVEHGGCNQTGGLERPGWRLGPEQESVRCCVHSPYGDMGSSSDAGRDGREALSGAGLQGGSALTPQGETRSSGSFLRRPSHRPVDIRWINDESSNAGSLPDRTPQSTGRLEASRVPLGRLRLHARGEGVGRSDCSAGTTRRGWRPGEPSKRTGVASGGRRGRRGSRKTSRAGQVCPRFPSPPA